jgi:hypothetical protein
MSRPKYLSGAEARLGDIVDVGGGHGPRMRVVVIIPTHEAAPGFSAAEWAYLGEGIMLEDLRTSGLLHLDELDDEQLLVERA